MRTFLPALLTLCLVAGCGDATSPSRPSPHKGSQFADITAGDALGGRDILTRSAYAWPP